MAFEEATLEQPALIANSLAIARATSGFQHAKEPSADPLWRITRWNNPVHFIKMVQVIWHIYV